MFIRVYRLEIQSAMFVYIRPSFVNCCHSNLSLAQVLSLVGDYILHLQEFNTLYMTRFRTYKLLDPPNKNLGGEWTLER
jgi:hypothetical protein